MTVFPIGLLGWVTATPEDDLISTAFDARLHSVLVGVDTSTLENLVLGIAIGYENMGSLECSLVADREDFDSNTLRVNARLEF